MKRTKNINQSMEIKSKKRTSINIKNEESGTKNFEIYALFNFIFGFLLPLVVIVLDIMWVNIKDNEVTTFQAITFLLEALVLLLINEFLVCKVTKKVAKSTYLLSRFALIFNCITILFIAYLMFTPMNMFITKFFNSSWIIICIGMIGIKLISYILAKKFALKEKIEHKSLLFGGFCIYIVFIFIFFSLLIPNGIDKFLFNAFGNTDFSSKKLKVYLTDICNTHYNCRNVSYFDEFTDKELDSLNHIKIENQKFTTEDINKLKYLNHLRINNVTIDNLDFQLPSNIKEIELNNVNIKTINITEGNLIKLDIDKSKVDNFKIQDTAIEKIYATNITVKTLNVSKTTKLDRLWLYNSSIENVVLNDIALKNSYSRINIDKINNLELKNIKDLNNLLNHADFVFRNIKFLEDKGFRLENNDYLELSNSFLKVPEKTKVKELILENMTAIVLDRYRESRCDDTGPCIYYGEEKTKVQGPESILGDEIELYDKSNEKLFEWSVSGYRRGEL